MMAGLLFLWACDNKQSTPSVSPTASTTSAAPADGPPCECKCECGAPSAEARELLRSAQRKIAHHDPGCMEDLNRLRSLAPQADKDQGYTRAQCEMVVGHCDAGRARVIALLRDQQGMGPDMAARSADGYVSLYCRSPDADPRDRLLGALYDLSDGAYMNRRSTDFCQKQTQIVRELLPRVRPQGPDDNQIASAKDTVYVMAARCFGRAGDCTTAWTVFEQLHPRHQFDGLPQGQRKTALRSAFDSIVEECKR